jgi:anaerobic ribonucleoside-triphosphate reductase
VLRELVTWPFSLARAALDLPRTMDRSIKEANELMELSREQLEVMRRQADQALEQAERMNDLLARVVKLTEPLERAQKGGEYVGERLKRVIFGEEQAAEDAARHAEAAAKDAEAAAEDAEEAAQEAGEAAEETAP